MTFNPKQIFTTETFTGEELAEQILDTILDNIVQYFEDAEEVGDEVDEILTVTREDVTLEWLYTFLTPEICQKYLNLHTQVDEDELSEEETNLIDNFLKEQKIILKK